MILVSAALIGLVGQMAFALQESCQRARTATLEDMMERMARAIASRHDCLAVGIYVLDSDGRMRLSGYRGSEEPGIASREVLEDVAASGSERVVEEGHTRAALVPIRLDEVMSGVLMLEFAASAPEARRMAKLGRALAEPIAVGIHLARLRREAGE